MHWRHLRIAISELVFAMLWNLQGRLRSSKLIRRDRAYHIDVAQEPAQHGVLINIGSPNTLARVTLRVEDGRGRCDAADLGAMHLGSLDLDIAQLGPGSVITIDIDAATDLADFTTARASRLARGIQRRLLAARRMSMPPLTITRHSVVEIDADSVRVLAPIGRFARETASHLQSVLDLAAYQQTIDAPLPLPPGPLISIVVPAFNSEIAHLRDLLRSFQLQLPDLAELIFSDDASTSPETRAWLEDIRGTANVRVVNNPVNRGIGAATNAGIAVAVGEWVALLDHDDALTPFALERIARALLANPVCQFLYTDEVVSDESLQPTDYFLKPAWDRVLLSGVNYINHMSVYRRERLVGLGGLSQDHQGSQDYEALLRYTRDLADTEILHLPYPAYLWRRSKQTFSARFMQTSTDNARRALLAHYGANHVVTVGPALTPDLHRVAFDLNRPAWPKVSVVIPNKDAPHLMRTLINGLMERTDYPSLEIIVIDNGTSDPETLQLYETSRAALVDSGSRTFQAIIESEAFNFSRSVNKGIRLATGHLVLLLNNDIEIQQADWLKEMVSCFDLPHVGVVGAKLLYPDRTLQHAGVIAGLGGLAAHWHIRSPEMFPGSMGRLWVRQTLSCVTGACMLIGRDCLTAVGDFDETRFAIAYNDIDFCLRATHLGFRVIWTPFACLIHHESKTRGSDETPDNIMRFRSEQANLKAIHKTEVLEDPAFNPWLSRDYADPFAVGRASLPMPRKGRALSPSH